LWLGLASLFFYAYWNWKFLFLFIGSIVFNYIIGHSILSAIGAKKKKYLLVTGLVGNLGLLAYFKYTNFLIENIALITNINLTIPDIILPIGISFFTFTQIAFLVDCHRGHFTRYRFTDYILFVSFFPHLVAGPILMHNATIPQFESNRFGRPSSKKIYMAIIFFSMGLFKKVIIADNLAYYVDIVFRNIGHISMLDAWGGALLFTFQIYFDFSSYSEMAIGLALLLNVRIPFNFNSPYKSISIVDFWRRWHISLSRFLRDYLYIPLGGNRIGGVRRYLNLFTTMLLGGLWHGPSWTFVVWGGLHGSFLAINHAWRRTGLKISRHLSWLITFSSVMIAWVFFRSQSLSNAFSLFKSMLGLDNALLLRSQLTLTPWTLVTCIAVLIACTVTLPNAQQIIYSRKPRISVSAMAALMFVLGMLGMGTSYTFIYFQF
jgi:alginate O-acetyltransferase complex protein AlgI